MKIYLAKEMGFCFGLIRASDIALSAAEPGDRVETIGPLAHNGEFMKYLNGKNIFEADDVNNIKARKVIIRAHGIPRKLENSLKKQKIEIHDATCPFVKRVQNLAASLEGEGYKVLILGKENHPEVIGIKSYVKDPIVIRSIEGIPSSLNKNQKVALISQTTQKVSLFKDIAEHLTANFEKTKIVNTICDATEKRQKAAEALAKKVDLMIVVGGRKSSNTNSLREVCGKYTRTHLVETANELKKDWFKNVKKLGFTASASAPDFVINRTLAQIEEIVGGLGMKSELV